MRGDGRLTRQPADAEIENAISHQRLCCMARVWNEGFLAQCRSLTLKDTEFCKAHTGPLKLADGQYDNPIDLVLAARCEAHRNRKRRAQTVKDR